MAVHDELRILKLAGTVAAHLSVLLAAAPASFSTPTAAGQTPATASPSQSAARAPSPASPATRIAPPTQPTAPLPHPAGVPEGQWGLVRAERVHGYWRVFLQNERLLVRIDKSDDKAGKYKITAFCALLGGKPVMISDSIDSRHSPGPAPAFFVLTDARVLEDGPRRKTVQLDFGNGKRVQNVSIFPNSPVLEIEYLQLNPNKHTVDLRIVGGSTVIYGAQQWQQQRGWPDLYPNIKAPYLEKVAGSYYRHEWGPGPLNYHGHLIAGRYDKATGVGLGLVVPFDQLAWFKLVRDDGLERMAKSAPYKAYYFAVTGGDEEIVSVGKQIAEGKLP